MSDAQECVVCGGKSLRSENRIDRLGRCLPCAAEEFLVDAHPMQQIRIDPEGVPRFRKNAIVCHLLDTHPTEDLHTLGMGEYPRADYIQMAQLIGYSASGFGTLSYVTVIAATEAADIAQQVVEDADAE